ncbi:MAG: T9SS type A sorting domain-containing protein [Bacteroidetes bacterium]|nr:T9SS type A sorting domain-containing protein [Bacteroidota bacterium]
MIKKIFSVALVTLSFTAITFAQDAPLNLKKTQKKNIQISKRVDSKSSSITKVGANPILETASTVDVSKKTKGNQNISGRVSESPKPATKTRAINPSNNVNFVTCPAEAGTVVPATPITVFAGANFNLSTTGSVNTNIGTNPCIGWGYWVASDPLGIFPGMTGIGNLPSGNNPIGVGGDPNFVRVWTNIAATGANPTLPSEGNGVTYYVAPITMSNCSTGEIATDCFDIGNVTQVYMNPEINIVTIINCNNAATPNTTVTFTLAGGKPSVNGSNFTITNLGGGTLSTTTLANNGQATVTGIPHGGSFSILVTDETGCSKTITIDAINATSYCSACGVNAGSLNNVQTGNGNTIANNGTNGTPFVLCYGDNLSLTHLNDYVLPANLNVCGNPPGPLDYNGATPGNCNPGIIYGVFSALAVTANPFVDLAYTGIAFVGKDQNFLNDGTLIEQLIANSIPIVNNTFYLYPVTADITNINLNNNLTDGLEWSEDWNGDGCVDAGNPITITMLNPIVTQVQNTCSGPKITITGGHSEFFTSFYAITNNGAGSISGTPVSHGNSITITGLPNGSPYSITITDFNGCPHTVTGTYNWINPTPVILNLASSFCNNDPVDNFNATPIGNTVTVGSFNINFVSDGFCSEWTWVIRDFFNTIVASGNTSSCALAPNVPLAPIVAGGLNPANGPFTLTLSDANGDGQDGTGFGGSIGSTSVINNVTGNTVAFTSGNWGASTTLNLGNFASTTTTFSGVGVTNTGNGTASFNPNTVGTHTITLTHNNGEGCVFTTTQNVTVHPNPILGSVTNPTICSGQTILLSNFVPGETNGVAGTGVWYVGTNNLGALAATGAITPLNGAQYFYQYTANAGGCSDGEVLTVNVNSIPTITGSTAASRCGTGTLTLEATASAGTINWYAASTGGSSMGTGASYTTPSISISTTYYVDATNGGCTTLTRTPVVATVNNASSATQTATACGSYVWPVNGTTYNTSGSYNATIPNAVGCDSVITLNLIINNASSATQTATACGSYIWPVNGTTYNTSGSYNATIPNVAGCDSLITLNLIINNASSATQTATACGSYVWSVNSTTYNTSGSYNATIPNALGCDSVITLNLIINNASSATQTATACGSYVWPVNGATYNTSGSYNATIPNAVGCDSVITLNLTINNVDVSVTTSGIEISANAIGQSYQWINCVNNQAIINETNQSFTAASNGDYAVVVTDNNCSDTSACTNINTVVINDLSTIDFIMAYPNPTNGSIDLDFGQNRTNVSVSIKNVLGQILYQEKSMNSKTMHLNLIGNSGVYFIDVQIENGQSKVLRIVVN